MMHRVTCIVSVNIVKVNGSLLETEYARTFIWSGPTVEENDDLAGKKIAQSSISYAFGNSDYVKMSRDFVLLVSRESSGTLSQ